MAITTHTTYQVLGYMLASMIDTNTPIVKQIDYDYVRYNYPVVSVQAIVHKNGQPKIVDILTVRKTTHE